MGSYRRDARYRICCICVSNPGCCPRFRWSHVLLNHHSTAPVNRHFVKSTAPRGQRAVKRALNPGYSRVKPPLCPGGSGGRGFQLTDVLFSNCNVSLYVRPWRRKAVPSEILVKIYIYILDCKISLASFVLYFQLLLIRYLIRSGPSFL